MHPKVEVAVGGGEGALYDLIHAPVSVTRRAMAVNAGGRNWRALPRPGSRKFPLGQSPRNRGKLVVVAVAHALDVHAGEIEATVDDPAQAKLPI